MQFTVIARLEDEGIFMDLFRANRHLFKDVRKWKDKTNAKFEFIPRTILHLGEIKCILEREIDMGTEFTVQMDLG